MSDAIDFQKKEYTYRRSSDQDAPQVVVHPVVVIGAGPVGLSLAIDLAQRGQPVVLLDNDNKLSSGSRAICFSKRSLEIFDRLGCGQRMVDKGVSWNVGKVFLKDKPLYGFDLLPEPGHARPAFINLQQYYVEGYLAERAAVLPNLDIRWLNKVTQISQTDDATTLTVDTPEGSYTLQAQYVVACDGSRSSTRQLMGLETTGRVFQDRFLIADVKMTAEFPTERWFWFDPPFHPNQSVLLHRQPDHVWRIDFQLGWDADPEEEKKPEKIIPRVKALLAYGAKEGQAAPDFELEWASVYTFACQRMTSFRHGRVLFAGDSAHGVSPFGARGANSGIQDAENLAWKLDAVLRSQAPEALLNSYASEREYAADENIRNSSRATDFITPKSDISRVFRDAVLDLAKNYPFARTLVNSGRLSVPATLHSSVLNTPDGDAFEGYMVPGSTALDAPVQLEDGSACWLLRQLGAGFTLMMYGVDGGYECAAEFDVAAFSVPCSIVHIQAQSTAATSTKSNIPGKSNNLIDRDGLIAKRYDMQPGTAYLLRPDQHVCARWRQVTPAKLQVALNLALFKQSPKN
ncbi:MAG: FAD-dependent oxidoreductase [Burkholderiaceae bacterium]